MTAPRLQVLRLLMSYALCAFMALSCASTRGKLSDKNDLSSPVVYGSPRGERTYFKPDGVRKWEAKPCTTKMVGLTHVALAKGIGSPGMAMYYYRCRGPNDYQLKLKALKARWRYE